MLYVRRKMKSYLRYSLAESAHLMQKEGRWMTGECGTRMRSRLWGR